MRAGLQRALRLLHRIEDATLVLLLCAMIGLAGSQIMLRNLFAGGLSWADPLLRILVLWVGLVGALVASRENKHIAIDLLPRGAPVRLRAAAQAVTALFTAAVAGVIAYHGARFVVSESAAPSGAVAGLPVWLFELIIPVAFSIIAARHLSRALLALIIVLSGDDQR